MTCELVKTGSVLAPDDVEYVVELIQEDIFTVSLSEDGLYYLFDVVATPQDEFSWDHAPAVYNMDSDAGFILGSN